MGVLKLWIAENGVCERTITQKWNVQSITWMPTSEAFVSIEGSKVYVIHVTGRVEAEYDLGKVHLHAVTITPDEKRLLAVGKLNKSKDGLNPAKSRKQKRIILFNLGSRGIKHQVPVVHEVRDISLSFKGRVALISYEHKAPPQLFRIETDAKVARLVLQNTYVLPKAVDFAGSSSLGHLPGMNQNHLVLCAGKAGDIHIWDHESARYLHSLPAEDQGSNLTCIAWNHASASPLMLASAGHNGIVRIWTAPVDEPPQPVSSTDQNWLTPNWNPPRRSSHLSNIPEIRVPLASPLTESPRTAPLELS